MRVDIAIQREKCSSPLECARCLRICPVAVLCANPGKVEKYKETASQDYYVEATFYPQCIACMKCVEACPTGAVSVSIT